MIGNGVVIDLEVLFHEIDGLEARRVSTAKLLVSANAHIIAPYNRTLDKVTIERFLGARKIGTTGRGIGRPMQTRCPATIRVQDLFDRHPGAKVRAALGFRTKCSPRSTTAARSAPTRVVAELLSYADRLAPMVADTSLVLERALDDGATVLLEAGRRRCSMSTTAPTPMSPPPRRPRVARAPGRASRRRG